MIDEIEHLTNECTFSNKNDFNSIKKDLAINCEVFDDIFFVERTFQLVLFYWLENYDVLKSLKFVRVILERFWEVGGFAKCHELGLKIEDLFNSWRLEIGTFYIN